MAFKTIPLRFIVIDDDMVNNLICSIVIKAAASESKIKAFEDAEEGFKYIRDEYSTSENPTILFLDINMPTWSGWDFLDNFEMLDEKIKKQFQIHMLSSSIDLQDRQHARENANVADYIEKPLTFKTVLSIINNTNN